MISIKTPLHPDHANCFLAEHIELLAQSYLHLLNKPLLAQAKSNVGLAEQLFFAPFVLLSHDTRVDPVFNYANKMALSLFELDWQQLVKTPSRLSAEQVNRGQREKLLAQVTEFGFIADYQGIRISQTGKRFKIENAVVWNIHDNNNIFQGQAACFDRWQFLD